MTRRGGGYRPQPMNPSFGGQPRNIFQEGTANKPEPHKFDEQLIVALDFGTTFSGIAFCFPNQTDQKVSSVMDWPGDESAPKIHSIISYDPVDSSKFTWGASVNRMNGNGIVGIKLLLDPTQERPLYLPTSNIQREIRKLPKDPVSIAADFIRALYEHALSEITKQVPRDYMSMCQQRFVLSVPAVWTDAAKDATLRAATMAGLSPITLIKEPEAAALYTLHSLDFTLNIGDAFVVCDAGGGTVDLISYEVLDLEPRLKLMELVPGTGGMAGSLGLNQRFVEAVKNLVGEDQYYDLRKTKGFWYAEKSFDREIKKAYRGDPNEEYFVTFPMASLDDDPASGLVSNTWTMTGKDLEAIFAPLVTDILRLIEGQVKSVKLKRPQKSITAICLVGGFGSSHYLKACVEAQYPDVHVLQPNEAWAAIAKGAALSMLPQKATVVSTSSTKHYGVGGWTVIDPVHDYGQPTRVTFDGRTRVHTMTWYIGIGDDLKRNQKIQFNFIRELPEDFSDEDLVIRNYLTECSDQIAPRHKSKGRRIKPNCTFTCDLRCLTRRDMTRLMGPSGIKYFDLHYDLVITLESAVMKFSLEINGKEMGSVQVDYRG